MIHMVTFVAALVVASNLYSQSLVVIQAVKPEKPTDSAFSRIPIYCAVGT